MVIFTHFFVPTDVNAATTFDSEGVYWLLSTPTVEEGNMTSLGLKPQLEDDVWEGLRLLGQRPKAWKIQQKIIINII